LGFPAKIFKSIKLQVYFRSEIKLQIGLKTLVERREDFSRPGLCFPLALHSLFGANGDKSRFAHAFTRKGFTATLAIPGQCQGGLFLPRGDGIGSAPIHHAVDDEVFRHHGSFLGFPR